MESPDNVITGVQRIYARHEDNARKRGRLETSFTKEELARAILHLTREVVTNRQPRA